VRVVVDVDHAARLTAAAVAVHDPTGIESSFRDGSTDARPRIDLEAVRVRREGA